MPNNMRSMVCLTLGIIINTYSCLGDVLSNSNFTFVRKWWTITAQKEYRADDCYLVKNVHHCVLLW